MIKLVSASANEAKAQQQPHDAWSLIGVITPRNLQSIDLGADNFIGPVPLPALGKAAETGASGICKVNVST